MKTLNKTKLILLLLTAGGLALMLWGISFHYSNQPVDFPRHAALFTMLNDFWACFGFFIALACAGTLCAMHCRKRKQDGRKAGAAAAGVFSAMLYITAALAGIVLVLSAPSNHLTKTPCASPDGRHVLYMHRTSPLIGPGAYVYGMYADGLSYVDLFDDDREELTVEWLENGFRVHASEYSYPD